MNVSHVSCLVPCEVQSDRNSQEHSLAPAGRPRQGTLAYQACLGPRDDYQANVFKSRAGFKQLYPPLEQATPAPRVLQSYHYFSGDGMLGGGRHGAAAGHTDRWAVLGAPVLNPIAAQTLGLPRAARRTDASDGEVNSQPVQELPMLQVKSGHGKSRRSGAPRAAARACTSVALCHLKELRKVASEN